VKTIILTLGILTMASSAALADGLSDAKRGFAAAQAGNYDEAVYFSSLAIHSGELKPKTLSIAYNNRGFSQDRLGRGDRALRDYSLAIQVDPNFAVAFNNRGYALNELGEYRLALSDFDRAIKIRPEYADAFNNRGIARTHLGANQFAIADYTRAIELKPNLYQAYNNRGYARFNEGEFDAAARDLKVSLERRSTNGFTMLWYYLARHRAGAADAEADLRRQTSGAIDPATWQGAVIGLFLGDVSVAELKRAAGSDDPNVRLEQECELYFYLGQYHLLRGDVAAAEAALNRAIETGVRDFTEYAGAIAELKRLEMTNLENGKKLQ